MKKICGRAALVLIAALLCLWTACGGSTDALYIFNTKGENAEAMQAACDAFTDETGIPVRLFSLGSGTDSLEVMRAEMTSRTKPAIFCVMNVSELAEWVEGGYARALEEAQSEDFRRLAAQIPSDYALTDGLKSYGIPFNVEGYGYVADLRMLEAIFGDARGAAQAIREADWEEWEALIQALDAYIQRDEPATVELSGKQFTLRLPRQGKAASLEGVFSTAGSQSWTYGDHMLNIALNAVFQSPRDALHADEQQIRSCRGAFLAYARALDLKTACAVTPRSPAFINNTTNGYDASVENLAAGKAVFLKQGNWVSENFAASSDPSAAEYLTLLPVKLPLNDADVRVSGRTAESINRSVPVYVPNYYVINAKVSPEQQLWAEQFLVWLNTDEDGQRFVTDEMGFLPYHADPDQVQAPNALGEALLSYISRGDTLSNPYAGTPVGWSSERVGRYVMENYLTREQWDEAVCTDIADYAVESWIEMR